MCDRLGDVEKRYYARVVDLLKDRDEEEEADRTFAENVLQQIQADGVSRVFCDKDGSRAVERLLQTSESDSAFLGLLLEPVITDFHSVARDRCGSHPMEALLKAVGRHVTSGSSATTVDDLESVFLRVFEDIKPNLGDLLTHCYASHVTCAAIQAVSGVYIAEHLTRSRYSQEFRKVKFEDERQRQSGAVLERSVAVPQNFSAMLNKVGKSVCQLENLPQLLVDPCASPVLQVLLRVLMERLPKRGNKLIRKVIKSVKLSLADSDETDECALPRVFTCTIGSHLIGVLLELAEADLHQWIWETCFEGKSLSFALHPVANYPLQQFMAIADSDQVSLVIAELLPHLEDVLFVGHSGVVVKLAEAGLRSTRQQNEIFTALLNTFHVEMDAKCCVPLFLALTAYEVYVKHKEETKSDKELSKRCVHVQGSLMVQALVKYENPRVVVRSILNMETEDIMWLSCDVAGSHVVGAFLTSTTVNPAKKRKFIAKLRPHIVSVCKDKHGSRVVDAMWRSSEVTMKESLVEELLAHEDELASDFYGRIVMRNCNVNHFKRKQAVWEKKMEAVTSTRELFRDILEDEESLCPTKVGQTRKKKRKTEEDDGLVPSEPKLLHKKKKRKEKDPVIMP